MRPGVRTEQGHNFIIPLTGRGARSDPKVRVERRVRHFSHAPLLRWRVTSNAGLGIPEFNFADFFQIYGLLGLPQIKIVLHRQPAFG